MIFFSSYEALPSNYGLGHTMIAGAFAGIAVRRTSKPNQSMPWRDHADRTLKEHSVMYPVDLLKVRLAAVSIAP